MMTYFALPPAPSTGNAVRPMCGKNPMRPFLLNALRASPASLPRAIYSLNRHDHNKSSYFSKMDKSSTIHPQQSDRTQPGIAFIHEVFPCGGAERVSMDVSNFLADNGYRPYIFTACHDPKLMPADIEHKYEVVVLPSKHVSRSKVDADFMIDFFKKNNIRFLVSARILRVTRRIIHETGCKYIHTNHGTPLWEAKTCEYSKQKNATSFINKVLWYAYYRPILKELHFWEKKFERRYRKVLAMCSAYTVLCPEYREYLLHKVGLEHSPLAAKVHTIPNAQIMKGAARIDKEKIFLYVGRLTYSDKRVDRLIRIWSVVSKHLPDWHLYILGDGEERAQLEDLSKNLSSIHFMGATNDVRPYYDKASILCLVSEIESWGLCLTEAQANGVIPVAFDCSAGVRNILSPSGENGFIIPNGDMDAYCETLVKLANAAPEEISRLRRNVIEKSKIYSIENVGRLWLDMLKNIK